MLCLTALLALAFGACTIDNPVQKDGAVKDLPTSKDGVTDGVVDDARSEAGPTPDGATDGPPPDAPREIFDGRVLRKGNLGGGSGVSTGGTYTLQSQIGPGLGVQPATGGTYELRWNASIIPW